MRRARFGQRAQVAQVQRAQNLQVQRPAIIEVYQGSMPLVGFEQLATTLPEALRGPVQLHTFVLLLDGAKDEVPAPRPACTRSHSLRC
jgi:hypothetical protein